MATSEKQAKPLIVWTLQRTGGTNLAARLFEKIGLKCPQHEPFNVERIYGGITAHWNAGHDRQALQRSVDEIIGRRELIKHCVEMVPWEVTQALVQASAAAGYVHLFLYRRNPLDRLLSLQFAKLSGVWGTNMKDKASLNDRIFAEPLPVQELARHEHRSAALLVRTWDKLKALGAAPIALAYEDIYQAKDASGPIDLLLPVISSLGLSRDPQQDLGFISELVGKGDQGTRQAYASFKGIDVLERALQGATVFAPARETRQLQISTIDNPWVIHAAIDPAHSAVVVGMPLHIGGVVVLSKEAPSDCALRIVAAGQERAVKWGIPSPWMAKKHPDGKNASTSRFVATGPTVAEFAEYEIRAVSSTQGNRSVFHFTVSPEQA